jgi:hypothetical protein
MPILHKFFIDDKLFIVIRSPGDVRIIENAAAFEITGKNASPLLKGYNKDCLEVLYS